MRHSSMVFALLLAPLTLTAQSVTGNRSPSPAAAAQPPSSTPSPAAADQPQIDPLLARLRNQIAAMQARAASACPVGFSVDQRPDGAVVWTNAPQPPAPHGPGLDIHFRSSASLAHSPIVSATITVHGMSPRLRALPIAFGSSPAADATETFSLGSNSTQPLLNPSIWTRSMSAITWVELTQLVYADGTTWQAPSQSQCIARPSPFVLVNASPQ